jgi:hypothetical protein
LKLTVAAARRALVPLAALAALAGMLSAVPARAEALVPVGTKVDNASLHALTGGKQPLLGGGDLDVLFFFRPGQERSSDVLRDVAGCQTTLATKKVRVVALVSSSSPVDEIQQVVKQTGISMPVLLDTGDELYNKLDVRAHPVAFLVKDRTVVAVQPYVRLRFCELLMAHVQLAMKEITAAEHTAILNPAKAPMPSDDVRNVAMRHVNTGERYLLKGNCALALIQFDEALALDPMNTRAVEGKKKCESSAAK